MDKRLGLPEGTVAKVGGVTHRYFATTAETAAELAAEAARAAMAAAGCGWADIDALVSASATMDQGMPCNAALVHRELGLDAFRIPAFDINASCLGFLVALDTLSWALTAGKYRRVLVVASDLASCGLNWEHLESSAIFGDGAAAAVLGTGGASRLLASAMMTLSEGADYCRIPAGGSRYHPDRIQTALLPLTRFHMDGKSVFRLAAQHLPGFVGRLLEQAQTTLDDIDWVVPHQASHLAMSHIRKSLGIPPEKFIDIFAEHGNQVAASLPTALDIAIRDGRIRRNQRILLLGTGAGLSIGGAVMVY